MCVRVRSLCFCTHRRAECPGSSPEMGSPVATGEFGADMLVALVNGGSVTLWFDTKRRE